ncbi:uncharacterized protein LOC133896856 [Phragmites australis]|uniref:uncharacterized protein LOC133896856 n=1 Tax=Phragmites australis TaxID=29695 RepID=UPI002D77E829|nr:uncharacterized protein LOC133896856 [Phragmites australis]
MPRVGGSRRDQGPDGVLPESWLLNEEAAEKAGLTAVIVVADFLRRRLLPLREQVRPCWYYTGPQDITRMQIGEEWDIGIPELKGLLRVVIGVDDLSREKLPWKELALYADPNQAALQATLPEFEAQGLIDRLGRCLRAPSRARGGRRHRGRRQPSSTVVEPGPSSTAVEPGLPSAVAEPGLVGAAAELGPTNMAAETETEPPPCFEPTTAATPKCPAPSERAERGADDRAAVFVRATNEDERRAMEEERKALEEAHAEVARERKALEDARAEVDQTHTKLQYWGEELQHVEGELQCREEDVAIRETDAEITAVNLVTREDLLAHREAEAAEAAATAAAWEERAAKFKIELAAREQALSVLAGQVKLAEAQALGAGSAGAAGGQGLEEQLRTVTEELEAVSVERASLQLML